MSSFEKAPEIAVEVQKQFELIDLAATKLIEKYKEYPDVKSFILYVQGVEKMFIEAEAYNWKQDKLKEELLELEKRNMNQSSGVEIELLDEIVNDFGTTYVSVQQVAEAADKLLEKYADCEDCKKLIMYLRYLTIMFIEVKDDPNKNIVKERLYKIKMKELAEDGVPGIDQLEAVYKEFIEGIKE